MIAYLSGKLVTKKPTEILVDVQGIGYRVLVPTSTYQALPAVGEAAMVHTHFHVREDAQQLYGFATKAEQKVFGILIGVSGIGPKLALAALSAMSPSELRDRVVAEDTSMLTNIPGVGKKTAARLVVELRDRLIDVEGLDGGALSGGSDVRAEARADALAALEALGLSRAAAERALRKVLRAHPGVQSPEELVRLALREQ